LGRDTSGGPLRAPRYGRANPHLPADPSRLARRGDGEKFVDREKLADLADAIGSSIEPLPRGY
jgi:hypothetical protein